MRIKKAHLWAAARVLLAVTLLGIIFKYMIPVSDTVYLKDGSHISGTFVDFGEGVVGIITEKGTDPIVIPVGEIATKDGELRTARGFIPLLREMTLGAYLVGLVMLGWIPWLASLRWKSLLGAQGIRIGFWRTLELTYLGLFCNNFMPGLTGGDVVKAYYASKLTSTKKTNAVVTVFLDRLIGLVMLGAVAG
ncbi:MAG: flippase-like domain-containing protein, partial [Planctomycetes bacterium]|nr:flippase-like domain-containing protein [Planctomycetota bacterium]